MIFKDAVATIRRTGQEYQYQLVVQRAYEEGEEELAEEEDDEGATDALDKDERVFLLDQALHSAQFCGTAARKSLPGET